MDRRTSDHDLDAELGPDRSRFGGFLRGALLAVAACAAVAVAVMLALPPPADPPQTIPDAASVSEATPAADGEPPGSPELEMAAEPSATERALPDAGPAVPAEPELPPVAADATPPADATLPAPPADTAPGPAELGPSAEGIVSAHDAGTPEAPADATRGFAAADQGPTVNATPFDAPARTPLLAVVLVGGRPNALPADRLDLLTMPLTIAIPPESPGAAELGAAARAAGHEVLVDLDLAEANAAPDRIAALDMAVGATATERTLNAGALEALVDELARRGLAWVETGGGTGTPAGRIAREQGMTLAQADRMAAGETDPDEIYRAIDSAAQTARRSGTSVLFLDATEQSMEALVRWGLEQSGDDAVWFAPISAVIARRAEP